MKIELKKIVKVTLMFFLPFVVSVAQGDDPVVSVRLENHTEGTVYWAMAFEETDSLDGMIKEKLGHWIPMAVYELSGPYMNVRFDSVESDKNKNTTFEVSPVNSDGEVVSGFTFSMSTGTPAGKVGVSQVEKVSDDLIYLHFDFVGTNRRWMFKQVSDLSDLEEISVTKAAVGFRSTGKGWKADSYQIKMDQQDN